MTPRDRFAANNVLTRSGQARRGARTMVRSNTEEPVALVLDSCDTCEQLREGGFNERWMLLIVHDGRGPHD